MEHVSASVVARFPADSSGELAIEPDLAPYADDAIHLLLYPHTGNISVYATVGSVTVGNTKAVLVPSGAVSFSGGRTAALPRPVVAASPELRTLIAIDEEGDPLSVGFSVQDGFVVADRECHASVAYSAYTSAARRLAYRPVSRPLGLGVSVEFGSIVALRRPTTFLIYPVQPFSVLFGNALYELYRIVSNTVTTPEGEFEKPANYPTNPGTYTGSVFTLDVSVSLQTERVHEIGYMDQDGRGFANSYFVSALNPFVGDNNYTITKTNKIASVTQFPRNLQLKALDFIASRGLGTGG